MYLVSQKVNESSVPALWDSNSSLDLPSLHEFATVLPATGWSGCTKGTNVGCYLALQSGHAAARKCSGS